MQKRSNAGACPTGALKFGTREQLLNEAHARIAANPGKYHENRVYGENEVGGALQLILSHVPFEKLGLPTLGEQPLPELTRAVNLAVPAIFLGVGGLASVIYRTRKHSEEATAAEEDRS